MPLPQILIASTRPGGVGLPVTAPKTSPLFEAVHIPFVGEFIDEEGRVQPNEPMENGARAMPDELVRVEAALRPLRGAR